MRLCVCMRQKRYIYICMRNDMFVKSSSTRNTQSNRLKNFLVLVLPPSTTSTIYKKGSGVRKKKIHRRRNEMNTQNHWHASSWLLGVSRKRKFIRESHLSFFYSSKSLQFKNWFNVCQSMSWFSTLWWQNPF